MPLFWKRSSTLGATFSHRAGWVTPDDEPSPLVCHQVFVPSGMHYEAAFRGAMLLLTDVYNWEKSGTQEPQAVADAFFEAFMQTVNNWDTPCE
jgi:hypothetical protein